MRGAGKIPQKLIKEVQDAKISFVCNVYGFCHGSCLVAVRLFSKHNKGWYC